MTAATAVHFHPLPGALLLLIVAALILLGLGIDAVERLRNLGECLGHASGEKRRAVLREMVSRVELHYHEPDPGKKKQWYRLARGVVRLRPQPSSRSRSARIM